MTVSPRAAVDLWRNIRAIQARGNPSKTHLLELRAALNELGHVLGYDAILIEPHRVARWPAVAVDLRRRPNGALAIGKANCR